MTTYIEPFLGGGAVALSLMPNQPTPFLRWPGGKRKLAKEIIAHLKVPTPTRFVLADINPQLIDLWRAVRDDADSLLHKLHQHPRTVEGYKHLRTVTAMPDVTLYLNLFCFNGLQRVNSKGQFNTPPDKVRLEKLNLDTVSRNVLAVSRSLRSVDVTFLAQWYAETIRCAQSGDYVYCDPPYVGTFTGYAKGGFGEEEQADLIYEVGAATIKGAVVAVSNSKVAKDFYVNMCREYSQVWPTSLHPTFHPLTAHRSIAAKSSSRGAAQEILVTLSHPA